MSESTKQTENSAENGNKSKPMLGDGFLNNVSEKIVFNEIGNDVIYELEIKRNCNFNFKIGDYVYAELPKEAIERIKWFYPNVDIQGIIVDKWVNLSDNKIHWLVDVDFVRCD